MVTKRSFDSTERWAGILTPVGIDGSGVCAADVNGDGCVDADDRALVSAALGACEPGVICHADVNGDCVVDSTDYALVWAVSCDNIFAMSVCNCTTCHSFGESNLTMEDFFAEILGSNHSAEVQAQLILAIVEMLASYQ